MQSQARLIAIGSGKGGVGKSVLAANIAIYLAQTGRKVILVDLNLGSPNLHTILGVDHIDRCLHRFLANDVRHISDALSDTPIHGLHLISGRDDGLGVANPRPMQKKRLLTQLRSLDADYVILDLAGGSGFNALDALLIADHPLIVVHSEPTAIESGFRLLKSAYSRQARHLPGIREAIESCVAQRPYCGVPSPLDLARHAAAHSQELAVSLLSQEHAFRPMLIVNQARTRDDLEIGPTLSGLARRHLGMHLAYVGHVEENELVSTCIHQRKPLLIAHPQSKICADIERIVRHILSVPAEQLHNASRSDAQPHSLADERDNENHYELLGIHASAGADEIRRAYRRLTRVYGQEANVLCGILAPDERDHFMERLRCAYTVITDTEAQASYRHALFQKQPTQRAVTADTPATCDPDEHRSGTVEPIAAEPIVQDETGDESAVECHADSSPQAGVYQNDTPSPIDPSTDSPPDGGVADLAPAQSVTASTQEIAAPEATSTEEAVFDGSTLRSLRESQGISLQELSKRTKISVSYLAAIENEHFEQAPAPVYLGGFVKAFAQALKLDSAKVSRSYMDRYEKNSLPAESSEKRQR